jgi:hypothetical protein
MTSVSSFGAFLAGVVLAGWGVTAQAADIEKLVPDDADLVVSVQVKQVLVSPVFAKDFQKQVEGLLKMEAAQLLLKDSGLDPLRDIDRVVLVMGRSSHQHEEDPNSNKVSMMAYPFAVVQGRFDRAKLEAKAAQLAAQQPGLVKIRQIGAAKVAEIGGEDESGVVAVLDYKTVVAGPRNQVADAIDRAAGKKKGQLRNKQIAQYLQDLDSKQSIESLALAETVVSKSVSQTGNNKPEVKLRTIGDAGIAGLRIRAALGDDIKVQVAITAKDAAQTKTLAEAIAKGLKEAIGEGEKEAARIKELGPVMQALKAVKVGTKDQTITLEGRGGGDAALGFFQAWFMVRVQAEPAPARKIPRPNRPN